MTVILYVQPYNIYAAGFCFENAEQYHQLAAQNMNGFGQLVEEYKIQFIEGEFIDAELAEAFQLDQGNFPRFLEMVANYTDDKKRAFIVAVRECGYSPDKAQDVDIDIYPETSIRGLAVQLVADGLLGDVPTHLLYYLDYDAIARELALEYTETEIAGQRFIYRCG